MAKRRRRNPINLKQYGDLFGDVAAEFDVMVETCCLELYDHDPNKAERKKAANLIIKAWLKKMSGKKLPKNASPLGIAAAHADDFSEIAIITTAEVFEGDFAATDAKIKKAIRKIAGAIYKEWLKIEKERS
jgi:hypothetical protein